jgi:hypothetical protein
MAKEKTAYLLRLIVDLEGQLTSRGQNKANRVGNSASTLAERLVRSTVEGLRHDGEKESSGLSGTSLGASHEITTAGYNGDGVLLHRGGDAVVGELNVGLQQVVKLRVRELRK